jgi:hypothetical protein
MGAVRIEEGAVQQCKSAYGLCKGGKVNAETEYRVQRS